jgi:hypothetical protein
VAGRIGWQGDRGWAKALHQPAMGLDDRELAQMLGDELRSHEGHQCRGWEVADRNRPGPPGKPGNSGS